MFIFSLIALLIALSIHEYAHARAADELGDPTPRIEGRLSLNPLAHLDPVGTLALFFFRFGWGKPVQIDLFNLRNPRRDQALIALAGPASNFLVALVAGAIYQLLTRFLPNSISSLLFPPLLIIAEMNLGLGIFNLLPFGPLDGNKVLLGFLPEDSVAEWEEVLHRYGFFILLFLFLPMGNGVSILDLTLRPLVDFIVTLLFKFSTI